MSLIRSVNNDLKCGQFAPAGGGQFAPAEVVKINRQGVVSLLWLGLLFLSGLSSYVEVIAEICIEQYNWFERKGQDRGGEMRAESRE